MNRDQVTHIWAQQTKPRGKAGNVYFEGSVIYSYGSHFPMGDFKDKDTVLITMRTYSVSTAAHVSMATCATRHIPNRFFVFNVLANTKDEHRQNFAKLRESIANTIATIPKLRSRKADVIAGLFTAIERANEYAAHFKIGQRIKLPATTLEGLEQVRFATLAINQRKDNERRKREQLSQEEALAEWLRGKTDVNHKVRGLDFVCFRLIGKGETIQSTLGAEFPAEHAKRAWPMLQRIRGAGEPWHRNGQQMHLGHYQIDSIDERGNIVAGCHRIQWAEVVRVAGLLGLSTQEIG